MFGYTFLQILWYFIIYSFIGWCVEVIYCTVTSGGVVNRGFLNGPVCPVYGFGMLVLLFFFRIIGYSDVSAASLPVVFLAGMVFASLVEYIAGWGLMKLFHARWWDYSMRPFNLGGYICLQFSIAWGIGCVFALKFFHYPISRVVEGRFSGGVLSMVLLVLASLVFAADFALTLFTVIGLNKKLGELDELSGRMRVVSNELSERIGTQALKTDRALDESRVQMTLARYEMRDAAQELRKDMRKRTGEAGQQLELQIEELRKQTEAIAGTIIRGRILGTGRILHAFPGMKHYLHEEVLEKLKKKQNEK